MLIVLLLSNIANPISLVASERKVQISEAEALIEEGKQILTTGRDLEKAKVLFQQANQIGQKLKNSNLQFKAILGEASYEYQSGNYQFSSEIVDSILLIIPKDEEYLVAKFNSLNGNNLVYLGNYSKAYEHQLKALEYHQKVDDKKNLAKLHFAIGNNFFYQNHFELALDQFKMALELWKKENDKKGVFWAVGAIGSVYEHQSKMTESIEYSEEALRMAYEMESKQDIAWTLYNLGSIYTTNGDIKKGTKCIEEAHQIATAIKDYPLIGYTLEGFTKIHIYTKEIDKALKFLDQSYTIAKENNELATMPTIYKYYAEIYYQQNNLEDYKKYTDKLITLNDSLNNEELTKAMGSLKKDYEVRELERNKEIALLKKDAKISTFKKLLWMGGVSFVSFFLLLYTILTAKNNKLQKEKNQLLQSSNQKILEQVEQLKSSNRDLKEYANIISHDLKEPLRNIGSFASLLKRRIGKASEETSKEYMDFILSGVVQMQNLLEDLKSYSIIETNSTAPNKELNTTKTKEEVIYKIQEKYSGKNLTIESSNLPNIFMGKNHFHQILYQLIDNGIKFNDSETPKILIESYSKDTNYVFAVHDNGIGIDPTFKEKIFVVFQRLNDRKSFNGSGIGLPSCRKILNLYSGKIWTTPRAGGGSSFFFSIPNESYFKTIKKSSKEFTS